jgi:hypothetical protein
MLGSGSRWQRGGSADALTSSAIARVCLEINQVVPGAFEERVCDKVPKLITTESNRSTSSPIARTPLSHFFASLLEPPTFGFSSLIVRKDRLDILSVPTTESAASARRRSAQVGRRDLLCLSILLSQHHSLDQSQLPRLPGYTTVNIVRLDSLQQRLVHADDMLFPSMTPEDGFDVSLSLG